MGLAGELAQGAMPEREGDSGMGGLRDKLCEEMKEEARAAFATAVGRGCPEGSREEQDE